MPPWGGAAERQDQPSLCWQGPACSCLCPWSWPEGPGGVRACSSEGHLARPAGCFRCPPHLGGLGSGSHQGVLGEPPACILNCRDGFGHCWWGVAATYKVTGAGGGEDCSCLEGR